MVWFDDGKVSQVFAALASKTNITVLAIHKILCALRQPNTTHKILCSDTKTTVEWIKAILPVLVSHGVLHKARTEEENLALAGSSDARFFLLNGSVINVTWK